MGKDEGQSKLYKGLDHYQNPESVELWASDEFPDRESLKGVPRRDVLKLMGGAAMLAGLAGCRYQPARKIVPFVQQPEGATAGLRKQFATGAVKDGYAVGLLAESVDGRPVRLDGNPIHSVSQGAINSQLSAEILAMYDPDRLKNPTYRRVPTSWTDSILKIEEAINATGNGNGFVVLSESVSSPSLARLIGQWKSKYPQMKWVQYEPCNRDAVREGARIAFGQENLTPIYDFTQADVVVSIDADALMSGPMSLRYSRDLAIRRNPDGAMNRVYAFESHPTTLGISADHRFRMKPSEALGLLMAIAAGLGVPSAVAGALPKSVDQKAVDAVVADLKAAGNKSALIAGTHLPSQVQAAVMAINSFLGLGAAVTLVNDPAPMPADHGQGLAELVSAMGAGQVNLLLILGGNPVYTTPANAKFGELLAKVAIKAHVSAQPCETSKMCDYVLPESHFLESWGDGVAADGSVVITQPLIKPIYETRSILEIVDKLLGDQGDPRLVVKETARLAGEPDWNGVLSRGVYGSTAVAQSPTVTGSLFGSLNPTAATGIELLVLPDPMVGDGRYSNNMWLQETPKPITNLTWDNALLMSKATADRLGFVNPEDRKVPILGSPFYGKADMAKVTVQGESLEVPVWINLGMADDVVVLHMGYGRTVSGDFGTARGEGSGGGFDANKLRSMANPVWVSGVEVKKAGKEYALANAQHHNTIDYKVEDRDREIYKHATLKDYKEGHPFGHESGGHGEDHGEEGGHGGGHGHDRDYNEFGKGKDISLYPGLDFKDEIRDNYQWAMTIDLSLCTGCNACVTACQAENNIPVVGKEQVMKGREMHWIRIDRYYKGTGKSLDLNNPPIVVQPVTCMHCEQAPCEPVCPVAATTHSAEGLNQMVYNRCIGTRYCSNNCPYKVRRFNFFHFSQRADNVPVLKMLQNPDVTVRFRGVMEKCTFCVQRINRARIEAKRDDRPVADGEVMTACQSACPSNAIIFGDMRKPENKVAASRASKRNYLMLEELNTRPRTTYLSRISNPNPELEGGH